MTTPKPYNPKACCGADCYALEVNPEEPCWGDVSVIDEVQMGEDDFGWVHACDGHADCYSGGSYKPQ